MGRPESAEQVAQTIINSLNVSINISWRLSLFDSSTLFVNMCTPNFDNELQLRDHPDVRYKSKSNCAMPTLRNRMLIVLNTKLYDCLYISRMLIVFCN